MPHSYMLHLVWCYGEPEDAGCGSGKESVALPDQGQNDTSVSGKRRLERRPVLPVVTAVDARAHRTGVLHAIGDQQGCRVLPGRQAGAVTVLVSHRFSTVLMADLIVYLDHGRAAEIGTHDELLARRGRYAELFEMQAAGYR